MAITVPEDTPENVLCPNCGKKRWTFYSGTIMVEQCPNCGDSEYRFVNHEREVRKNITDP